MKKKAQCILLDTEQPSKLVFSTSKYGGLFKSEHYSPMKEMGDSYKHLYFTSDEEIKEGDWVITCDDIIDIVTKYPFNDPQPLPEGGYTIILKDTGTQMAETCKKIVATTNPELFKDTKYNMDMAKNSWFNALHRAESPILIPRIGDDFVEAYIKAYNEGHPITEVMLDYTFDAVKQWIGHTSRENYRPKLRSNGTVIISPCKEDLNPNNLEIGKEYWIKYLPCSSMWEHIKITRFTNQGYAWGSGSKHNGIISQDLYDIKPFDSTSPVVEKMYSRTELLLATEAAFAEGVNAGRLIDELPTPRVRYKNWIEENFPQ